MKITYALLPLVAMMALTRVHHFGSLATLPDASLAVFFLAGLCFKPRAVFAALLIEAAVLDFVAIHYFNVSDWCLSPAYIFLIPTYAALWLGGRFSRRYLNQSWLSISKTMAVALVAGCAAFAISNGSFYLFSGRYEAMPLAQYVQATGSYVWSYLGYALLYTSLGLSVLKIWTVVKPSLLEKQMRY